MINVHETSDFWEYLLLQIYTIFQKFPILFRRLARELITKEKLIVLLVLFQFTNSPELATTDEDMGRPSR